MKYIAILISISFLFASCAPHSTISKHKRYHNWKQEGPEFPSIGNLGYNDSCEDLNNC